jgi:hypothetical protein
VAVCSVIGDLILDDRSRRALELAEAFANGLASADELGMAYDRAVNARGDWWMMGREWGDAQIYASDAVTYCAALDNSYASMLTVQRALSAGSYRNSLDTDTALFIALVYDVVGNPFRPVTCDPRWRTSDTVGLAQAIYDDRAFDRLPILADALMDAGCEDEQIISHCRSDGPHVRGCWVVDLVLGKE